MKILVSSLSLVVLAALIYANAGASGIKGEAQEAGEKKPTPESLLKRFVDECVEITPGKDPYPSSFTMGGPVKVPLAMASREVQISTPFRVSRFEVTQELYRAVMGTNPSRWQGERNSVEMVSFIDADHFCQRITVMLHVAKLLTPNQKVRLPTELEWEYCCRAGTNTAFSFGDSATVDGDHDVIATVLNEYAWHTGNAAGNDPVVGALKPNPWGLYDFHGYLWEYVLDPYTVSNSTSATPDEKVEFSEANAPRVIRGGSWRDHHSMLTSYSRMPIPAYAVSDAIGFRCVIEGAP